MNLKPIAGLARELTQLRGVAIYALIACAALATALYSCSQPPAQRQPTPLPPVPAIVAATPVPPTPAPPTQTTSRPTPSRIAPSPQTTATQPSTDSRSTPAAPPTQQPTPQMTVEPTPTPIPNLLPNPRAVPDRVPLTQITAGKYHACGLKADGTALCWGRNIRGSLNVPDGLTFSRISAGLNFTCGLRIDGAIACWGNNNHAQASPPDGSFDEIAAGRAHACALDDGALICWGRDFPDGAETIQEIPPLSTIQAGAEFTCGLTPDADAACWDNRDRELAITPGPFTDIGIGLHHVCAIGVDGSVFCGAEDQYHVRYARLSDPSSTKFIQISGGWFHACGITETSDIECWGSGERGMPGERLSAPEGEFTAISIGWRNSCALNPDGYAICWNQPDVQNPSGLSEAFGGIRFERPVELFSLPSGEIAVVERKGVIAAYSAEPDAAPPKTMLDLTEKTICCKEERGMFSAALDPQFEEFPFLYVYYGMMSRHAYGENMPGLAGRLARFRVESGRVIRDSELTILDVPQPRKWHHGGAIRFGSDGMLYLGIGDNSAAEKSQSLTSLLGKIIRIDVRGATPEQPYRIPPDNPFVNNPDALPEIWAYGLRNPWRMDFAPDGRLFVADVGYQTTEEVSLAAAGANLGWPMCEGNICEEDVAPDADGLTAPIFTYGREDGCAIIGGVTAPLLNNAFLFGDYCSRWVYLLEQNEQEGWQTRALAQAERYILSFGIDADGTVYILTAGRPIMRLQPEEVSEPEE